MLKLVASLFLSKSGSDSVRVQVSLFVFAPTITPKIKLMINFITPSFGLGGGGPTTPPHCCFACASASEARRRG